MLGMLSAFRFARVRVAFGSNLESAGKLDMPMEGTAGAKALRPGCLAWGRGGVRRKRLRELVGSEQSGVRSRPVLGAIGRSSWRGERWRDLQRCEVTILEFPRIPLKALAGRDFGAKVIADRTLRRPLAMQARWYSAGWDPREMHSLPGAFG